MPWPWIAYFAFAASVVCFLIYSARYNPDNEDD